MDFSAMLDSMQSTFGDILPGIFGALAFLVIGWIVALVVRALVRRGLGSLRTNERIASVTGTQMDLQRGVSTGAYYLILLLALIGCFNALDLELVAGPLQALVDQFFAYAPKLIGAGGLILVAWILATILRKLVTTALASTSLDEKLSAEAEVRPLSQSLGNVVYWLLILLFLPAILGTLGLEGLLLPVQGMVDSMVGMLPNIFAAVVLGVVGWFVAKLLRDLVTNLLSATGIDRLGQRAGLKEKMSLSRLIGLVVYIFVFVPALIAALEALQIEAISGPATSMLGSFMAAIPNLFAAAIILAVAWFVAGFVASLLTSLLSGVGFDDLPARLGLGGLFSANLTPSSLVGKIVVFFAMVFASVEAANRIGFTQVAELVATFIEFGGQVLLGVVIIAVGMWIGNLAHGAIRGFDSPNSAFFAGLARYAILGLVLAMGLRAMGIADDIVNMAFTLTLGAVAVAVALSFGLGGREAAGKQMDHWMARLRGER